MIIHRALSAVSGRKWFFRQPCTGRKCTYTNEGASSTLEKRQTAQQAVQKHMPNYQLWFWSVWITSGQELYPAERAMTVTTGSKIPSLFMRVHKLAAVCSCANWRIDNCNGGAPCLLISFCSSSSIASSSAMSRGVSPSLFTPPTLAPWLIKYLQQKQEMLFL